LLPLVKPKPEPTRSIRDSTTTIVNSSALSVQNVMNGANNYVEWKTLIRIYRLDLQVQNALLTSGAFIPSRERPGIALK